VACAVFWPDPDPDWLAWAPALPRLRSLRLTAARMHLQPEEGLAALLPLRRTLAELRLDGCVLLTPEGAPLLAQLPGLTRLEVTCCQLGQEGVDALAALTQLGQLELRFDDGVAGECGAGRQAQMHDQPGCSTPSMHRVSAQTLFSSK
jgi:hypothetical protein